MPSRTSQQKIAGVKNKHQDAETHTFQPVGGILLFANVYGRGMDFAMRQNAVDLPKEYMLQAPVNRVPIKEQNPRHSRFK